MGEMIDRPVEGVCPENGPALNGANALVNGRVSFPIPDGFQFVAAQLDDTSSDFGQPWSYNPSTGIWRMPPAARFINTLLVTVRRTSASGAVLVAGHIVSWEDNTPSPAAFEDHTHILQEDPATVVPDNDDRATARVLTAKQGTTNGDLGHATSRYIPPGANGAPAVLDLPNLPPRTTEPSGSPMTRRLSVASTSISAHHLAGTCSSTRAKR